MNYILEEFYGNAYMFSEETVDRYGRVVLTIAGGDGEISEAEWRVFEGIAKACEIPPPFLERWRAFDFKTADLKAEAKAFWDAVGSKAYAFLYDAVKVCSADGYHAEEKKLLRQAAAQCEIPESVVRDIENLVLVETATRELRISLLFPEPTRFHDPSLHHK
jgi:tellurite resistance protein